MLFNSLEFAVFFPLVALLFFLLPVRARMPLLLVASCGFYMAFVPAYILILFAVILIDFVSGLLLENAEGRRRRVILAASLTANLSLLGFFKYFNFFQENLTGLWAHFGQPAPLPHLAILLPIGLSFHTFQSMSYTLEVYWRRVPPERSLLHFAVYVLFFPQLVAGPIERPQNLLAQFHNIRLVRFDLARCFEGLKLIASGLFKKVVIADRLAILVDAVYAAPAQYSGAQLLIATYAFSVQIYCDFSGYSDIARGTARILGIDLMLNFWRPYFAQSVGEFWRRWHISLSTWFRDYVFIPLGGSRVPLARRCVNLMIVFFLSGIWHGANWTFVVWGLLHGFLVGAQLLFQKGRISASSFAPAAAMRIFCVFNLLALTWVFFRAANLGDAFLILHRIVADFTAPVATLHPGLSAFEFLVALALVCALFAAELIGRTRPVWDILATQPRWLRWGAYYAFAVAFLALALTGPQQQARPFVYFQF